MIQSAHQHAPTLDSRQPAVTILRARGLRKAFGGQIVLDGIDLDLRKGEVILLRGENGSGKTTLLNILTGNLEPDAGDIHFSADDTPRSYHFPRRWWQNLNPWDHFRPEFVAREGIGRTWQDGRLFRTLSLRDNIAVANALHPGENPLAALLVPGRTDRHAAEVDRAADAMLARLGLSGREHSSGDKVSLGQSKRVAVARTLAGGARMLFLDEPLAGLDGAGINDVLEFLKDLVRDQSLTLVIVEHVFNHAYLDQIVTTDWLLENGRLQCRSTAGPTRPGAAREHHHDPSLASTPGAIQRPAWFHLLANAGATIIDEQLPRGALLTRILRLDRYRPDAQPILEIEKLVVQRGQRTVIGVDADGCAAGFNLALREGEIALLQAPNGWGKTTLGDAIAGLQDCKSGQIRLGGQPIQGLPSWRRRQLGLSMLPATQNIFPTLRTSDMAALAGINLEMDGPEIPKRQSASSMSGGERQLLAVASTGKAPMGIYDEPFQALDGRRCALSLQRILDNSKTILFMLPFGAAVQ